MGFVAFSYFETGHFSSPGEGREGRLEDFGFVTIKNT